MTPKIPPLRRYAPAVGMTGLYNHDNATYNNTMLNRYHRQIILPELGEAGQKKLAAARVLCVGAGGLGSPALLYLAAAGIGRIGIIDADVVDTTNLQRQVLFTTHDVGLPKISTAQKHLQALNPDVAITVYDENLTAQNATRIIGDYDYVLDGTDNFTAKYVINDTATVLRKPWAYGAIQGFSGQASLFDPARGPCYRCLFPEPPAIPPASCAEAGVIGAVAGLVGTTQALQIIQHIVGHPSFAPLIGKLWMINSKTMATRIFAFAKNLYCPCYTGEYVMTTPTAPSCPIGPLPDVPTITIADAKKLPNVYWLDVREADEFIAGHIDGAHLFPLSRLQAGERPTLPTDQPVVVYCQRGRRSAIALDILRQSHSGVMHSMDGGFGAWVE